MPHRILTIGSILSPFRTASSRPLREDRLSVELALLACHWLGEPVLIPAKTYVRRPGFVSKVVLSTR